MSQSNDLASGISRLNKLSHLPIEIITSTPTCYAAQETGEADLILISDFPLLLLSPQTVLEEVHQAVVGNQMVRLGARKISNTGADRNFCSWSTSWSQSLFTEIFSGTGGTSRFQSKLMFKTPSHLTFNSPSSLPLILDHLILKKYTMCHQ